MVITTLIQILAGLLTPVLLARLLHHRADVPYLLVVPGIIAALVALLITRLLDGGVLSLLSGAPTLFTLPIYSGGVGLIGGLVAAFALVAAFVWLAPAARTFPRVLMIGIGFGSAEVAFRAALAALVLFANVQLYFFPPAPGDLTPEEFAAQQAPVEAYFATPATQSLLDTVVALGRIAQGVSVVVLGVAGVGLGNSEGVGNVAATINFKVFINVNGGRIKHDSFSI